MSSRRNVCSPGSPTSMAMWFERAWSLIERKTLADGRTCLVPNRA